MNDTTGTIPKSKTARLDHYSGSPYWLVIYEALKDGEGEHDYRVQSTRARQAFSCLCDQELFDKVNKTLKELLEKHYEAKEQS